MRKPPRQLQLIRGIGLFDALIALAILSFGLLAMTRFQSRMIAQTTESMSRQTAGQFSAELLSTVLVDVNNAPCYTLPQAGVCNNAAAAARTTDWATRVAAALPGPVNSTATLDAATGQMTLVIDWQGKESGETRRLETVTDVRP
ncbi:MAG: pilus assembly protein PilV [Rubrivivax sp.]|nr:pilus assembly protein PilV [Rubrivivax sp.]